MSLTTCPCGSLQPYKICCQPYHLGKTFAPTAQRLMQSRYAAFVRKDAEYLHRTWAKQTRPSKAEIAQFAPITWQRLQILEVQAGGELDTQGIVTFVAQFADAQGKQGSHQEESQFIREKGRWVYLVGDTLIQSL